MDCAWLQLGGGGCPGSGWGLPTSTVLKPSTKMKKEIENENSIACTINLLCIYLEFGAICSFVIEHAEVKAEHFFLCKLTLHNTTFISKSFGGKGLPV